LGMSAGAAGLEAGAVFLGSAGLVAVPVGARLQPEMANAARRARRRVRFMKSRYYIMVGGSRLRW
jgi:hypothetical protein